MSYFGKSYKLERQENFEEFVNSLGTSEEHKKTVITFKPTVKITKNGDSYTFSTSKPDNSTTDLTFKSGIEFDEQVRENTAKTTFTVESNTLTQVQKFADGKVVVTYKREFDGDNLLTTITSTLWNGVARRYYKAC